MIEKINKVITTVDIDVDSNMDADDYGSRISECVSKLISDHNVVNLIKVHLDSNTKAMDIDLFMTSLQNMFNELNINNIVLVPVGIHGINDISVNYINKS